MRRNSSIMNPTSTMMHNEENTRHWSFTAFEWIVKDVHKLKEFVEDEMTTSDENAASSDGGQASADIEVLKESPMLGDGKFKLEIAKSPAPDASGTTTPVIRTQPPTLSLYITSVMLEYAHTDYEIYTSMFAGIKCQDDRVGERGARPDWAWEFWQSDWVFREDSEVWECPLPPLSVLLEIPRIRETNSFVICVQIHSPVGPFFPQQPSVAYVPRDLLDGLEASLDNSNTGDVQFICLERRNSSEILEESPDSPNTEVPGSRRSSSASGGVVHIQPVARKRIIYAHSDILTRRSEYFATMLNSSFAENLFEPRMPGERKTYTIAVEEADFLTIYWLLKWVYANWLLFKEQDDPKAAVDGVGAGWSAKSISNSTDEWGWKAFSKTGFSDLLQDSGLTSDTRSATSGESVPAASRRSKGKLSAGPSQDNLKSTGATGLRVSAASTTNTSGATRPPPSPTRRSTGAPSNAGNHSTLATMNTPTSPSRSSAKTVPVPVTTSNANYPPGAAHYPVSPRQQRQRSRPTPVAIADPHPHPTPTPPPASALSMYQVAHRYSMPGLAALSLEHMMSTITPQSSFALLLATSAWDELHGLVEDYVVEKWDEVSLSPEFEQCCQEVAAGEWGPEGGKTMMALFRRLRSPNAATYARA
ncbi:unnamed protein product [Somion occarium]|uniref:BTB domain-containing protein n=1 Tax=Somion occarium TaxID=3059160 RepID=A0ABP1D2C9_9APHY